MIWRNGFAKVCFVTRWTALCTDWWSAASYGRDYESYSKSSATIEDNIVSEGACWYMTAFVSIQITDYDRYVCIHVDDTGLFEYGGGVFFLKLFIRCIMYYSHCAHLSFDWKRWVPKRFKRREWRSQNDPCRTTCVEQNVGRQRVGNGEREEEWNIRVREDGFVNVKYKFWEIFKFATEENDEANFESKCDVDWRKRWLVENELPKNF